MLRAIVPVLFLSRQYPLTTSFVISCHYYRRRYLNPHYIANHIDQTKGLNLPR